MYQEMMKKHWKSFAVHLQIKVPTNRTGIVIEIKYAEDGNLDAACEKALKQIEEKDYVAKLKQDGMKNFIKYGIACFKKICKVVVEQ